VFLPFEASFSLSFIPPLLLSSSSSEKGYLQQFLEKTQNMEPLQRGEALEGEDSIAEAHEAVAQAGQTEVLNEPSSTYAASPPLPPLLISSSSQF
jgi:hypothetical protein